MFLVAHCRSSLPMATQLPKHAPEVPGRGWAGAIRDPSWLHGKRLGDFRKKNIQEILPRCAGMWTAARWWMGR